MKASISMQDLWLVKFSTTISSKLLLIKQQLEEGKLYTFDLGKLTVIMIILLVTHPATILIYTQKT